MSAKINLSAHENVPAIVRQYALGALDPELGAGIRFNHARTLQDIRDYCTAAMNQYTKMNLQKGRAPSKSRQVSAQTVLCLRRSAQAEHDRVASIADKVF